MNFLFLGINAILGLYGLYTMFFHGESHGVILAITFGSATAPSSNTEYLDSIFSQSLANYRKTMTDNIGAINAFLFKMMKSDFYEEADGGKWIAETLMYGLAPADSYDGYDELSTAPTDGVTQAEYEWRQIASPIVYNTKEVVQNKHRIIDFVETRIKQGEMGLQEYWAIAGIQGSGDGALATPKVSAVNGSNSIEPLGKLVAFDPTTSTVVGNINQSTNSWWRNKTKTSSATTYDAFMTEMDNIYNSCALGTGGPPDLILADQVSYELFVHAYWQKYKTSVSDGPPEFPFECKKFKKAVVVLEDKIPDYFSNLTSVSTYGSMLFLNTQFFRVRYDPDNNFEMIKDENGKTFKKPVNANSRVGHVGWMGNITCNNRRKQGVWAKIARTLT